MRREVPMTRNQWLLVFVVLALVAGGIAIATQVSYRRSAQYRLDRMYEEEERRGYTAEEAMRRDIERMRRELAKPER